MKCGDIQRVLPEYTEGALEEMAMDQVREHLRSCPACAGVARELDSIVLGARHLTQRKPAEAYWNSLLPRIHERIERRSRRMLVGKTMRYLSPVAVTLAVFLLILSMRVPNDTAYSGLSSALRNARSDELQLMADQENVLRGVEVTTMNDEQELHATADVEPIQDILTGDQPAFSSTDDVSSSVLEGMNDQQLHALLASVDVPETR